jgi:hypothetical protein
LPLSFFSSRNAQIALVRAARQKVAIDGESLPGDNAAEADARNTAELISS